MTPLVRLLCPISSRRAYLASIFSWAFALAFLPLSAQEPAPEWQRAILPWAWQFPRDHGAHPAFKTEWWYLTGSLKDAAGRAYGYELTIFRQGIQPVPLQKSSRWAVRDIYFGHLAVSELDAGKFRATERLSRGVFGEAGAETGRMAVKLGPWTIDQAPEGTLHVVAREGDLSIDLTSQPEKPLVLQGRAGLSQKATGAGQASYYYSYPRLGTTGRITVAGQPLVVTGQSWFDHEFSTSSLGPDQVGWDWFCVQLDNHEEIMLYAMRLADGRIDPNSEGTWVHADGTAERLPPGSFTLHARASWRSPHTGATYPAGWSVSIPARQAELKIEPRLADQELSLAKLARLAYWEGACAITGTVAGQPVTGLGYTELTGYAGSIQGGLK